MDERENSLILSATKVGAAVFNVFGVYDDSWCAPHVSFGVGANSDLTVCELTVWLRSSEERTTSLFSVRFNDREPFEFDVPHEHLVCVQAACPCAPGDTTRAAIQCANLVRTTIGDVRPLSFMLLNVRFS